MEQRHTHQSSRLASIIMQQATLPLPATHPARALQGLARQIALPHEFAPMRFPSFPALERTALMGFSQPTTLALPANTATRALVFRQAAFPVWADRSLNAKSYTVAYASDVTLTPGTGVQATYRPIQQPWAVQLGSHLATNQTPAVTGTTSPDFYAPVGQDLTSGNIPFVYVPNGWSWTWVAAGVGSPFTNSTTVNVTNEYWSSPGECYVYTTAAITITAGHKSGAVTTVNNGNGFWVRPVSFTLTSAAQQEPPNMYVSLVVSTGAATFTGSISNAGSVAVAAGAVTGLVPLVVSSEYSNSTIPWMATRTTAVSFLGTNVTQVLNKGGTVLAGRMNPETYNAWAISSSTVSGLHPAEKAYLPLETGVYTYVPPSTDLATFHDYTSMVPGTSLGSGNATSVPLFLLNNDALYHIMFITASGADETLACTVDWHVEFRTSSALFQIGLSTMTLETLHQAQISLAEVGYFFENINHKALLTKVTNAAKKYGPAVAMAAKSVLPPQARAAMAVGQAILSSRPSTAMPTTTAKASGILPKKAPGAGKQKQQKKKKHK